MKHKTIVISTKSEKETQKIAFLMAREVTREKISLDEALVFALQGELGAGKTVFVKGFAKGLGIKRRIVSPTFVLMRTYAIPKPITNNLKTLNSLIHIDAYRLKNVTALGSINFSEMVSDPQNIILIEWAERVKKALPKDCIIIHIDHINKRERKITIR